MEPYIGEIRMFAGDFAPRGWALCDGSLLRIDQWDKLFSIIQTYYGGDGASYFAVPDLRGRAPVNAGASTGITSGYYLGQKDGSESVVLSKDQMPAHSHLINANSTGANQVLPTNFYPSALIDPVSGDSTSLYSNVTPDVTLNVGTVSTVGGTTAVKLVQPVLAITFIIALEGIYPPRP